jgi:alpha-N-arabinofuranosidase
MGGPMGERRRFSHSNPCFANDVRRLFDAGSVFPMNLEWGIDELFNFATAGGAEMVGTVNFGTGTAQEAANFVEYANGVSPDLGCDGADGAMVNGWRPDSYSGAQAAPPGYFACLRHFFGREEPYGVRYWEVGNEIAGQSSPTWTADTQLYYNGGSAVIKPGFVTRDADLYDWSGKMRQTSCTPNERFYVQFPPIGRAAAGSLEIELRENRRKCAYGGRAEVCKWLPLGSAEAGWHEVASLTTAGPRDRAFEVDRERGYIQFGDGIQGRIPQCLTEPDKGYEVVLTAYPSGPHDGFTAFEAAMKAVDPSIRVGSGHPLVPLDEELRSSLDFMVIHPYMAAFGPDTNFQRGLNERPDLEVFRPAVLAWSRHHVELKMKGYEKLFGREIEFVGTEWNLAHSYTGTPPTSVYTTSLDVALFVADMLRTAIVHRVAVANFLGLGFMPRGPENPREQGHGLATYGVWKQTDGKRQLSLIVQPAGLVFEMFGDHFGSEALETRVTGAPVFSACWPTCTGSWGRGFPKGSKDYPLLEALASSRPDGRIAVLLINKSLAQPLDVSLEVASGPLPDGVATWVLLNSRDPSAHPGKVTNTQADPHAVSLTTRRLEVGAETKLTVPAHSVNIIVLPPLASNETDA